MYHRICAFCNQPFDTDNKSQKFCDRPHYRTCQVCGKLFEVPRHRLGAKDLKTTCSKKCAAELRKSTNQIKYGGNAPACSVEIQAKTADTNMKKFGVKAPAQNDKVKNKMSTTIKSKYGVDWFTQTSQWNTKTRETYKEKYGVDWITQSDIIKQNRLQTNLSKYGTTNPMQTEDVLKKNIQNKMIDGSKIDIFMQYQKNPVSVIKGFNLDHKPTIYELTKLLGVNASTVGAYLFIHDCKDIVDYKISTMEQDVISFIKSLKPEIKLEYNVHNVIPPKEIDIWLPEYNIGIECNPTDTHNSSINVFEKQKPAMSPSYHRIKTDTAESKGIFLFHLFSYDWHYKRLIMESIIRNLLHCDVRKIYARQCEILEVSSSDARNFLINNHRQGFIGSKDRIGLYYNNELVALMTFGKPRIKDPTECYDAELLRFCVKLNTSVVGGASKLFKHYINTHPSQIILSYSDRARTRGNLYKTLGFKRVRTSSAGYVWVNHKTDEAFNRFNAQRHNIKTFLKDDNLDMNNYNEIKMMESHGFVRVYDSGTVTWKWSPG